MLRECASICVQFKTISSEPESNGIYVRAKHAKTEIMLTVPFEMHQTNLVQMLFFFFEAANLTWCPLTFFPHPIATELAASGVN